eukprot:10209441-Heterocapsa_arctica.AAC.1
MDELLARLFGSPRRQLAECRAPAKLASLLGLLLSSAHGLVHLPPTGKGVHHGPTGHKGDHKRGTEQPVICNVSADPAPPALGGIQDIAKRLASAKPVL